MRVLQVIAELGTGGAEAVVLGLTEGLAERGHTVHVASDCGWRVPMVQRVPGAEHVRIPLAAPGLRAMAMSATRLAGWSLNHPVDLVHAHNVRATLVAAPVARLRRVPLMTTIHGLGAEDYPRAAQILRRASDMVVAVSAAVADDLEHAGLPGERIRLVENAVTRPGATSGHDPLPDVPRGEPVVLCAARMTRQKRQDILLRGWAATKRDGGRLLFAGDGPERQRLEALARKLNLGSDVSFLGDRDDVPALLKRADLLALPSDWEGLPIVVLEAMASGVPVLASSVGGLSELGSAMQLLPAQRSDQELVAEWASALDRVATGQQSAGERTERLARAQALVTTRFSPQKMVGAYLDLAERLLAPLPA